MVIFNLPDGWSFFGGKVYIRVNNTIVSKIDKEIMPQIKKHNSFEKLKASHLILSDEKSRIERHEGFAKVIAIIRSRNRVKENTNEKS